MKANVNIKWHIVVIILFVTLISQASVALATVSLQQKVNAEKQPSIYQTGEQVDAANTQTKAKTYQTKPSYLYGDWLFNGGFQESSFSAVNPNYVMAQGDNLLIQLWGGIDYQAEVTVDPQGNIYIPKVGPIKVLGVANSQLNNVILKNIKRVYKANVEAYVSLLSSQKVKVFLAGLVNIPGIYEGQSADSILRFIDLAGGIRADIGSYRDIQVKRNNRVLHKIDLYDFIQKGEIPHLQLQDGDVIFVGSKNGTVTVEGEVGFEGKYELKQNSTSLAHLLNALVLTEKATHVTLIAPEQSHVTQNKIAQNISQSSKGAHVTKDPIKQVQVKQYTVNNIADVQVNAGALIKVSSQLRAQSISVELLGEHNSAFEMVLPWGATLDDLLKQVAFTSLSNKQAIQLYRESVAVRQKDMLLASLSSLEQNVLTTRSETKEAAQLRNTEAETILQWIEKARLVEPKGQVLLAEGTQPQNIYLQQGDKIVIPAKRNVVLVHGEVLFPTAIAYQTKQNILDFIKHAGGTTNELDSMNILVMKPNGTIASVNNELNNKNIIGPGDEIFVLAKPDEKTFQLTKDITQVIYQIAASAAVFLAI
ncbi:MAG: protein involved in polysaccharide export with SLBB domain [Paraglaciecola sp.]|jgi:protein involved in polysaccharide export with SLBB domain